MAEDGTGRPEEALAEALADAEAQRVAAAWSQRKCQELVRFIDLMRTSTEATDTEVCSSAAPPRPHSRL